MPPSSPTLPARSKQHKKKRAGTASAWDAASWRPVTVDTHFTGTDDDGGFAGLEELPGAEARVLLAGLHAGAAEPAAKKAKHSRPPTDDLAARVKALEAENARLRAAVGEKDGGGKKERKKKAKRAATAAAAPPPAHPRPPPPPAVDVSAWEPCGLGPELMAALAAAGFAGPTPIQALALPPALAGRRDVLGAAPTGSGKTLAYGLAILQRLLDERAARGEARDVGHDPARPPPPSPLRALVLCPTRELALQVAAALDPFARAARVRVAPVVGGLAAPKQARLLAAGPAVVVATPGRLWAEVEGGHPHLGTPAALGGLAALVIDEADRMVADGSFPDLAAVLARVEGALAGARGGGGRGRGCEGGGGGGGGGGGEPATPATPSKAARAAAWAGAMQTFVFSATLTLPAAMRRRVRAGGKGGGAGRGGAGLDALVQRVPLQPGRSPALVDVGGGGGGGGGGGVGGPAAPAPGAAPAPPTPGPSYLAPGIEEAVVRCPDAAARDAALYCLLAGHGGGRGGGGGAGGKALIFVNAVSCARRLAGLLAALALPARSLHAGMQQRARLKALDRFSADPAGVLVATDVAARGLDVAGVRTVIHYQIPPTPDTYVHRCGRTARGVESAGGLAVSLVVPGEAARWEGLMRALGRGGGGGGGGGGGDGDGAAAASPPPPALPIDGRTLAAAAERVSLASVVDAATAKAARARADDAWRRRAAAEAGLALSDDEEGEGGGGGGGDGGSDDSRDDDDGDGAAPAAKKRRRGVGGGGVGGRAAPSLPPAAAAARARLAALLATPLCPGGGAVPAAAPAKAAPPAASPKPAPPARRAGKPASVAARRAAALAAAVAKRTASAGRRAASKLGKGAGRVGRPERLVVPSVAVGRLEAAAVADPPLAALRGGGGGDGGGWMGGRS